MISWKMGSLILSLALLSGATTSAQNRALTVADYFALRWVGSPPLSPPGAWLAHTEERLDLEKDESKTRIWMTATSGEGARVALTSPDESSTHPRFSPDGRYIAFLSARGEKAKTQVWALFRQGGEAVQWTDVAQGVSSFEFSPDGSRLVLVIRDPRPEDLMSEEEREKAKPRPWVIDRRQFKQDYVGYLDRRRTHLYVFEIESQELRQITSGDFDDQEPAFSPDSETIAFVSNRTADPDGNYNTDIFLVATANTDRGATLKRLTENPGPDSSPAFSPDGARLAYLATTDTEAIIYATPHLAVLSGLGDDEPRERVLTEAIDRHMSRPRFSADGERILFIMEDGGRRSLVAMSRDGGSPETIAGGERVVSDFTVARDGTLAILASAPKTTADIYLRTAGNGEERKLTGPNDALFSELRLGEVERIRFSSTDGTPIEAFVVKPPGFRDGLRYPAVLRIHGGPVSQYEASFHFESQLLAAAGYLVVLPNPRGSSGYGQAFSRAIWRGWGVTDFEDVMASLDFVIEKGWADPERLGVQGWSYGGMLTNHVITKTNRFAAAITGASATLYVANYGHDQYQRWWEAELGLPWEPESRKLWENLSPFNDVAKVETPTLILGGEKDWNVPIINSEQLYQALKRLGKTTELVVYPGEHHGIQTPSLVKDLYGRYLDWFRRYLTREMTN